MIKQSFKMESDTAPNGLVAVNMVKERIFSPYKLILMDCMMPIMDGFDATHAIRQIYKSQGYDHHTYQIVGLSAMTAKEDKERGIRMGMNIFSKLLF